MRAVSAGHRSRAAIMRLRWLEAALILGVMPHILNFTSPNADCLSAVHICMSDLCAAERTSHGSFCEENVECQMKGALVCNMSLQSILEQFPSLRHCACEQEGHLCDSIPALDAQCHQKPVHDKATSCLEGISLCVRDRVCNRLMAPVVQQCMGPNCEHNSCQQATLSFYRDMPLNVAAMLVMCQDSDESCLRMRTTLHSGTCDNKNWICLDTVKLCVKDRRCRELLSVFQSKCWSSVDPHCLSDFQIPECLTQMNPALIFGADSECQTAFMATLGTALHYPCTCKDLQSLELQTCDIFHEVFHNRTHFIKHWMESNAPTKPADHAGVAFELNDLLLSGLTCVLLVGITALAISIIILLARRREKNRFRHFQKSHNVIL